MKSLQRDGYYPREMLDSNLAMDREKIVYISRLPDGGQLILDALRAEPPLSIQRLAQRFGVEDMLHAKKDTPFMASLLYYFGVLTLGGRTPLGKLALQIPNLVVQQLYVERIREMLLPELDQNEALRVAEVLYSKGDIQPLCDFVEGRYFKALDNRDYLWANELTVKTAFLTLLFNDLFYVVDSETALERSYADLTLILRPEMRRYELLDILIEFKYVKLSEVGLSGAQVQALSRDDLCALPPVREQLSESQAKLRGYGERLRARYGAALRLRAYSVVAVGFERLVWTEVVDVRASG
jgi:hypothetical protein